MGKSGEMDTEGGKVLLVNIGLHKDREAEDSDSGSDTGL